MKLPKIKITYEDPLGHLLASFSDEQEKLWRMHQRGERIRCVTGSKLLSVEAITKASVKMFKKMAK